MTSRSSIIKVSIMGDAKDLEKAFGKAGDDAAGFGDKMSKTGKGLTKNVTAPVLGVAAGIVGLGKKAGDAADRLLDMEAQTGVSTDKLQEYEYVATQAGVGTDFYKKSVEAVLKSGDQLKNGTGAQAEAFEELGISVLGAGGELRSAETLTDEAMKALMSIEDPTKRAALAQDIFTRANQDLLPVLAQGEEAIKNQRQAAHEMGAVMGKDSLNSANEFRMGMDGLTKQLGTAVSMIGAQFAPVLTDLMPLIQEHIVPAIASFADKIASLIEWFTNLSPQVQGMIGGVAGLAAAIGPVLVVGGKLISTFGAVGKAFGVLSKLVMANPWVAIIAATIALVTLIVANWDTIVEFLSGVWDWIKDAVAGVGQWFKDKFKQALDFVKNIFLNFTGPGLIIKHFDDIRAAVTKVKDWIMDKFDAAIGFLKGIPGRVTSAVSGMFAKVHELTTSAWKWVTEKFDDMVSFVGELPGRVGTKLSGLWSGITSGLKGILNSAIDLINRAISGLNKLIDTANKIPGVNIGHISPIPKLHGGGVFRTARPGGEGLAILRDGERVVPASMRPMPTQQQVVREGPEQIHHHWEIKTPVPDPLGIVAEAGFKLRTSGV